MSGELGVGIGVCQEDMIAPSNLQLSRQQQPPPAYTFTPQQYPLQQQPQREVKKSTFDRIQSCSASLWHMSSVDSDGANGICMNLDFVFVDEHNRHKRLKGIGLCHYRYLSILLTPFFA